MAIFPTLKPLGYPLEAISILGSGWLGRPLAEHFVRQGYDVKASTRSVGRREDVSSTGAAAYIVDTDHLSNEVQAFLQSSILIVNITSKIREGIADLIRLIEKSPIKSVIYISSTSVYKNLNQSVAEDDRAENEDNLFYQIENLFRSNNSFQTTVIRFAGLIGYSRHPGRFFGDRKISQPGAPVNLIHRDDCIAIIDRVVEKEAWGEVLNACADSHPSKRDFYSYARQSLGVALPEFDEHSQASFKIISNEKLKQRLGYDFKHPDLMVMSFD